MKISEQNKELFAALAKFQKSVTDPKKDKVVNYGKTKFTYADLDSVLKAVRPLLAEQGLSFTQIPMADGNRVGVQTIIMHSSGQYIESEPFLIPAKQQDAQGYGSCMTYAKRYTLSALLGVSADEDDDGNYGSGTDKKPEYMNRQGNANRQQSSPPQNRVPQNTSDWLQVQQSRLREKCKKGNYDERFIATCMEIKFNKPFKNLVLDDYTSFITNFDTYVAETQEEAMRRQGAGR